VEWNVGESAGALAAFALETGIPPRAIHAAREKVRAFQLDLLEDGVPMAWLIDVPVASHDFAATQRLVMAGGHGENSDTLEFGPGEPIDTEDRASWIKEAAGADTEDPLSTAPATKAAFAAAMAEQGLI
jgi:hypothetical protein